MKIVFDKELLKYSKLLIDIIFNFTTANYNIINYIFNCSYARGAAFLYLVDCRTIYVKSNYALSVSSEPMYKSGSF